MRLEINGGKTEYDGVFPTQKFSELSVRKSKVSPIMNKIPIIIDITKGGVIDRGGSLVWWMTQLTPAIFKTGAWWSLERWIYDKYKPFWDRFDLSGNFRQAQLYEIARTNDDFVNLLQLIWIDYISERYTLQREVCKDLRDQLESSLLINLEVSYDELYPQDSTETNDISTEVSEETMDELSGLLGD